MNDRPTINRPDIFIVGTMKGGTTVLHEFMSHHPEIHAGTQKEIHYFSLFELNGPDWYHAHFKDLPPGQHYLDSSPTYFDMTEGPRLPARIDAYNPDARVIMLAREPIARAVSHFNHLRKVNRLPILQDVSAEEFFTFDPELAIGQGSLRNHYLMQCINCSLYLHKAQSYRNVFGDRFLVIDNDDLAQDPETTMARVFRHVGVQPIWREEFRQRRYTHQDNSKGLPLSEETIARLDRILGGNYAAFCENNGLAYHRPAAASVKKPAILPASTISNPAGAFDHAFIITYGHAGGGLLQELLNSADGVCIRGAHAGVLTDLAQAASDLESARDLAASAKTPGSSWFGASEIQPASFADKLYAAFTDHVLRPPEGTRILGFTGTRHLMSNAQFTAYCDNLRARFPRALLIFNTRDNQDVIAANRAAAPLADEAAFARADQQFRAYAAAHRASCIEIRYDDYIARDEALKPLFHRLGLPFDVAEIRKILATERAARPPRPRAPGLIENGVLIGKDDWLFLWDGSNEVHRYYTDPAYFSDADAQGWADLLNARRDRIKALGATYLHVTVPDKLSLLPEFVPLPMPHFDRHPARLVAQLLPGDGPNVDILPDLRKAAEDAPVFYRTDSHWNSAGCQAAYRRLCAVLGVAPRDFSDRKSGGRQMAMDLGGKFAPPILEEPRFTTILRDARRVAENKTVRYNEQTGFRDGKPQFQGCYVHLRNDSPDARPETVLLFGNSFSEFRPHLLTAMLAETYRELHFVWSASLDFDLIGRFRPQIVISEIAERFMATLPGDGLQVSLE